MRRAPPPFKGDRAELPLPLLQVEHRCRWRLGGTRVCLHRPADGRCVYRAHGGGRTVVDGHHLRSRVPEVIGLRVGQRNETGGHELGSVGLDGAHQSGSGEFRARLQQCLDECVPEGDPILGIAIQGCTRIVLGKDLLDGLDPRIGGVGLRWQVGVGKIALCRCGDRRVWPFVPAPLRPCATSSLRPWSATPLRPPAPSSGRTALSSGESDWRAWTSHQEIRPRVPGPAPGWHEAIGRQ